jgi:hypothetical protein
MAPCLVHVRRFRHRSVGGRQPEAICACSSGAPECHTLQSVSSRRDDAGWNRRHLDGVGAIKLEAAPRYHYSHDSKQRCGLYAVFGPELPVAFEFWANQAEGLSSLPSDSG